MSLKLSPPPVAHLHPRKPVDPMLITPGSKTSLHSNCLVLAWPSLRSSDTAMPATRGGGDDRFLPVAERSRTHAGLVVSPTGKPLLKVQSSYQGFFSPGGNHSSTPFGSRSAFRNNHERTSSFISLNSLSPRRSQDTIGWQQTGANDTESFTPGWSPNLQEDKHVRFRGGTENGQSANMIGESPGSSYDNMSISSINSPRSLSNSSYDCSERSKLHLRYKSREAAFHRSPSGIRTCQTLCWLLMTTLVFLILLFCVIFIYVDYKKSSTLATLTPSDQVTLKQYLKQHLIGQDIAIHEISSFFDNFLYSKDDSLQVPVVVSFHGGTGVGKSFTNQVISSYYFSDSEMSSCISTFSVPLCHSWPSEVTRNELKDWLTVRETSCRFHLFILEDFGSDTPCSAVSVIEENLRTFISEKSSPKHVIVLVTDVASLSIKKISLEYLETNKQEMLNLGHFTFPIKRSWTAIDEFRHQNSEPSDDFEHGCHFANLSGLVNISIPFLPLERHHVKQCVLDIAWKKHLQVSLDQVEWVADQPFYGPQSWPVFSNSGCKSVSEKLNVIYNSGEL